MSDRYTIKDLEMPDDEPMVIIRSSLLWICDGDKYAAAALNMYIHWTRWIMKHKSVAQKINQIQRNQQKTPTQDTSLIIYRKQSELVDDLLHFCNEKRLRQANVFLVSKGLLKIEDVPRHIADHILKYELRIDVFKKLMSDWHIYREGNQLSDEGEMVEVASEEDVDGTDISPIRNGQLPDSPRSRSGEFTDRNGHFTAPKVIDDNKETLRDDRERETEQIPETQPPQKSDGQAIPFSFEEQTFLDLFCQIETAPTISETSKKHCAKLAPHVKTIDKLRSLHAFSKKRLAGKKNNQVFLGNMVNDLAPWLETQKEPEQQEKKPTSTLTPEQQAKRDEIRQKLGKIAEGALNV